jgi:ribosomal protein S18 acetylase RimI-like enzyme
LNYQTLFNPSRQDLEPIDEGFHQFNLAHLGEDVISRYHRVLITAKDKTNQVIGGIHGEMYWDWLHIQTLWLDEEHRGEGIGSELLRQLEEIAQAKGYVGSHTETTNYQALDFYLKHGYQVFGTLEGKPKGVTWYYVRKSFLAPPPSL